MNSGGDGESPPGNIPAHVIEFSVFAPVQIQPQPTATPFPTPVSDDYDSGAHPAPEIPKRTNNPAESKPILSPRQPPPLISPKHFEQFKEERQTGNGQIVPPTISPRSDKIPHLLSNTTDSASAIDPLHHRNRSSTSTW